MAEYIAAGNVMIDSVSFADGSGSDGEHIGGPATFAYTGIKIWTDSVIQCSKLGADYEEIFAPWVEKNGVDTSFLKVVCDHCNHSYITYETKGGAMAGAAPSNSQNESFLRRGTRWEDFGFMKTSPEDIGALTEKGGVKGVYLAQNCDRVFWEKIRRIKERDGFCMMWELEGSVAFPEFRENIYRAAEVADIFSLNIQEAQRLFEVEGDEACIAELQKLPVSFTLFRVGGRGLYSVTPDAAYYLPPAPCTVVDPTGCGNTSTGAALYAYAEGKDPLMVGIMANVGSAMNINQYGAIPDMLGVREQCYAMAEELYKKYKNN
ncbi:MAG: carbohydrate kinase family protein [Clostridiales bacterium]|nr:carbohydrate kinase family protein [Clostridiales bacterium]